MGHNEQANIENDYEQVKRESSHQQKKHYGH